MNKLFPSACIKSHPPCGDKGWWAGHWTMPGAGPVCAGVMPRAVQCGLLGVMKAVSSPAQPAGGHTSPADNPVQTIPADNTVQWSDVRTTLCCLFTRLLFFPVHNHLSSVQIIYRQLCYSFLLSVSLYSQSVQVLSFASSVFGSAFMSCLLSS